MLPPTGQHTGVQLTHLNSHTHDDFCWQEVSQRWCVNTPSRHWLCPVNSSCLTKVTKYEFISRNGNTSGAGNRLTQSVKHRILQKGHCNEDALNTVLCKTPEPPLISVYLVQVIQTFLSFSKWSWSVEVEFFGLFDWLSKFYFGHWLLFFIPGLVPDRFQSKFFVCLFVYEAT